MAYQIISTLPLNGLEKYYCINGGWTIIAHAAHLTGNYSAVINNASIALQYLLKRHSRLRTRIRVDGNQYFLDNIEYNSEHLTSDRFFSVVETSQESWQEVIERECNRDPYSDDGTIIFPTFHFMLLSNTQQSDEQTFHLLLFQNHSISDGRSGYILINDLLTLVTTPNLLEKPEPLNTEILPLIGQLIPRPYGAFFPVMSFIGRRVFERELRHMTQPRIPVKVTPLDNCKPTRFNVQRYKIKFLFTSSSGDLYSKLHEQCRRHEVTLNGPLLACLLLAIHQCFPFGNNNRLKPFGIGTPFDMRMRLPQSPLTSTSVGFFVGACEIKLERSFSIRSAQFWSLAHQYMRTTRNQLKRNGVPLMMHIFSSILSNQRRCDKFSQLFPEGRQSEISFSNIGKYPFPCEYNKDELQLRGIHVVNNASVYRNSSCVYATCASNGQLDFSLAHEMESDEKAKDFLDYYVRLIEICADVERCKTDTTLAQLLKMVESTD